MNAEYINPFIEASSNIITQTTGLPFQLEKAYIKDTPYANDNVLVLIGLTGKISANAVMAFSKEAACKIASAMMMGMPVTELDDLSKSAVCELCNMIFGHVATLFSEKKLSVDITTPLLIMKDHEQHNIHKDVIISVPFLFNDGNRMEIDISYAVS